MDKKQDMEQLVHWLDELEHELGELFRSASWRVGHSAVRLVKGLLLRPHPPASTYRINEILRAFRLWKEQRHGDQAAPAAAGDTFPGYFKVLSSALTCSPGEKYEVRSADLPGLGLGLLYNFHYGTRLSVSNLDLAPAIDLKEVDFCDEKWMDPGGEAWKGLLAAVVKEAPLPADGKLEVLPAARRFAGLFAKFYQQVGGIG